MCSPWARRGGPVENCGGARPIANGFGGELGAQEHLSRDGRPVDYAPARTGGRGGEVGDEKRECAMSAIMNYNTTQAGDNGEDKQ